MKKIALALATVAAATAFAPEASAVPVFARQTGMACSACHFQHFPLLNGFGRAFKSNAYTMMGAQGKVEATEGVTLDIPDRLNMGVLTSAYYQNESNANATGAAGGSQARYGVPGSGGELSIFYGGRISEFAGFLSELGLANGPAAAGQPGGVGQTGAAKLSMLFPVADLRAGIVMYTGGQGAAYSFETLNTGAADTHKMMGNAGPTKQHVAAAYASSYLGTRNNTAGATGASVVVNNSMGFVNVGKWADVGPGTGNANDLPLTYARVATVMDVAGFEIGGGLQHFSGEMTPLGGVVITNPGMYNANVLDLQVQGEVAGMESGVYVSYGTASASAFGNKFTGNSVNLLGTNVGVNTSTLNVAASVEFMHGATVQAAMRMAQLNGSAVTNAAGAVVSGNYTDNAIMLGATYDLAQNVALGLNYTTQSGTAWDMCASKRVAAAGVVAGSDCVGKTATTLLLEALF